MKILKKSALFGILAIMVLAFTVCKEPDHDNHDNGDKELSGAISISPSSTMVGNVLTATYSGNESVKYQWKRGTADVGTNSTTYTPTEAGSYTVTVSSEGYTSKTSAAVTVTAFPGGSVPGNTLQEKLQWLKTYAQSNTNYIIEVTEDENISYSARSLSYIDKTGITITLKGIGGEKKVISYDVDVSYNSIFSFFVGGGVTLILDENITLGSRIEIGSDGSLIMNQGAKIFFNNSANGGANSVSYGGGVRVYQGATFTMNGGEISGNSAFKGGGVYVGSGATFTMTGGEISGNYGNSSGSCGGGVYVDNGAIFTMKGGEISGNSAFKGGGVYVDNGAIFTMKGGKIISNNPYVGVFSYGGGVYVAGGAFFTMIGGEISGDSRGGGVYVGSENQVGGTFSMEGGKISNNTFNNNTSDYHSYIGGGGVCVAGTNATFTMIGGEITGNTIIINDYNTRGGGGVYIGYNATFTMIDGEISGNTAASSLSINGGYGGGVCMEANATFAMNGGNISNNTASDGGGGVSVADATFTMNGGNISGNTTSSSFAAYDSGGGVRVRYATFTMNGGEIDNNTTSGGGGGVSNYYNSTILITGGKISGNTASTDGGGVHVYNSSVLTMTGGEISGNTANGGRGGGVFVDSDATFRIATGTVYGSNESDVSLRNCSDRDGMAGYVSTGSSIAQYGTFSGLTWNSAGSLSTTNDTIRVVNGVLQ